MKDIFEGKNKKDIYIYGAHNIAKIALSFLQHEGIIERLRGFVVTSKIRNPDVVEEFEVKEFSDITKPEQFLFIIAVPPKYIKEIHEYIEDAGVIDIIDWDIMYADRLMRQRTNSIFSNCKKDHLYLVDDKDDDTYMELLRKEDDDQKINRMKYKVLPYAIVPFYRGSEQVIEGFDFKGDFENTFGKYVHISSLPVADIHMNYKDIFDIYMICSHMDKKADGADDNDFLIPIQGGASLTNIKKCEVRDDAGENISDRNKTMAEMTAIYWIWKNAKKTRYKGICHYRRQFIISSKEYNAIISNDIDVVLNVPRFVLPSVIGQFERGVELDKKDKDVMLSIIQERKPEYYKSAIDHLNQPLFYSCNMMIAKQEIFDEYCQYAFDILIAFDDYFRQKEGERNIKFTAYWAEIITSIFFVHNKNRFKIAVADFHLYTHKEND